MGVLVFREWWAATQSHWWRQRRWDARADSEKSGSWNSGGISSSTQLFRLHAFKLLNQLKHCSLAQITPGAVSATSSSLLGDSFITPAIFTQSCDTVPQTRGKVLERSDAPSQDKERLRNFQNRFRNLTGTFTQTMILCVQGWVRIGSKQTDPLSLHLLLFIHSHQSVWDQWLCSSLSVLFVLSNNSVSKQALCNTVQCILLKLPFIYSFL